MQDLGLTPTWLFNEAKESTFNKHSYDFDQLGVNLTLRNTDLVQPLYLTHREIKTWGIGFIQQVIEHELSLVVSSHCNC